MITWSIRATAPERSWLWCSILARRFLVARQRRLILIQNFFETFFGLIPCFTSGDFVGALTNSVPIHRRATAVPAPSTWAMAILGFLAIGAFACRSRLAALLREIA